MTDESSIRNVFRQRAEQYAVRYDLPASVIVRTRRRLVAKATLAATFVAVAAWAVIAGNITAIVGLDRGRVDPASGGTGGSHATTSDDEENYRFSNVSVAGATQVPGNEGPKDLVLLRFDYAWTTSTPPGLRECLFAVYDAAGEVIGQHRYLVEYVEPEGSSLRKVDVDGAPASGQIECGPRLPDPESGYKITDVRVDASSRWEIVVSFDSLWRGESKVSGQVRCIASVFDAQDATVVVDEFTFSTEADRNDVPLSLEAPSGTGERADHAEVNCY